MLSVKCYGLMINYARIIIIIYITSHASLEREAVDTLNNRSMFKAPPRHGLIYNYNTKFNIQSYYTRFCSCNFNMRVHCLQHIQSLKYVRIRLRIHRENISYQYLHNKTLQRFKIIAG